MNEKPTPPPPSQPSEPYRIRVVELRLVQASELVPNPRRWRTHPSAQRRVMAQMLAGLGIADVLLARQSPEGLMLLDGHLRKDLAEGQEVPVAIVDLDEEEGDRFLVSADPIASMARAAHDALAHLMASVTLPRELTDEVHRAYPKDPASGNLDPDAVPDEPSEPRVAPGDVWVLGDHRIACGDARDPETLARLTDGERIELVWTDPPYGVSYVGKTAQALTIENDGADDLGALLSASFAAIDPVLAPGARIYVCHPAGPAATTFALAFTGIGWRHHQTLTWVKDRMVLGHGDYHYRHEPILYGYKPGPGRWGRGHQGWYGGNDLDSVIEVDRPSASREHPTMKPTELIRRCVQVSSAPGHGVLDPFVGSGSTLIACEELGRRGFAIELDPTYCQVAIERWEAFTGRKGEKTDG